VSLSVHYIVEEEIQIAGKTFTILSNFLSQCKVRNSKQQFISLWLGLDFSFFLISKPLHVNQRFLHYNISLYPERNKSIYWCDSGRPYNRQKDEMGPIYPGQKVLFNFAPFQCHAALIMNVEGSEKVTRQLFTN